MIELNAEDDFTHQEPRKITYDRCENAAIFPAYFVYMYEVLPKRKERRSKLEKKLRLLFAYQDFEKSEKLQAVIDKVHARYAARQLSDDEAELVAAAGRPEASIKPKDPKQEK